MMNPGILLVDMSNLVFSTVIEYHTRTKDTLDMMLLRNLVLDRLVNHKNKLKAYAEIVLCFDARRYWRREYFQYYKGKRSELRDKSDFDWVAFFPLYTQLKEELRENFPVRCLEVEGAEADDLIATLCKVYGPHKDICILSSDKDFLQIQLNICPRIKQWSLFHAKFLTPKNTKYDLFEHIVKGDTGDGVPNILTEGHVLVTEGLRQKKVMNAKLEAWKVHGIAQPEKFCDSFETLERFRRNKVLIDLREIPEELTEVIVNAFNKTEAVKGKVFNYYVKNKLTRLLANGGF